MAKKKKSSMAAQIEKDEQMPLIDVAPENAQEILKVAKLYKQLETERIKILAQEVEQKQKVMEMVKKVVKPGDDGKYRFKYEKLFITIEPRDELVKITEKTEKKKKSKKKEKCNHVGHNIR